MKESADNVRIDKAARLVKASPETVYKSFMNPDSLVRWLPPAGMTGQMTAFDPSVGGGYSMILTYDSAGEAHGKTSEDTDVSEVTFMELVPGERIVQAVNFVSEDAAFHGDMKQTWFFEKTLEGTHVTIICENVPEGISREDHDMGLRSTLGNLAVFTENMQSDTEI